MIYLEFLGIGTGGFPDCISPLYMETYFPISSLMHTNQAFISTTETAPVNLTNNIHLANLVVNS